MLKLTLTHVFFTVLKAPPADGPRLVTPLGFRPNIHFVGFSEELRKLHKRLQHEKRREMGSCAVLLWGEVGSGKTHLARQYFYSHRNDYPEGCFWVDCKSTESITKGLWDLGISIGALDHDPDKRTVPPGEDFADTVRQRLESLQGWLLVFDGVLLESETDLDSFRKYIPDRAGNCIIYTSVDRTLTHRHRLLYPSALKVGKLSVSDATELLYQNLGIRHPNSTQQAKALDLVKDNDYLPLAIYAAAHALIERGKTLERYTHTTADERLIRPFLEIIRGLQDQGRVEAVNLVNLLSFFTHQVPVALIRFGYKQLFEDYGIAVLSPKYANSTRSDLDSSISILLRSGLLERTLQTWTRGSGSSSPEESRSMKSVREGRQVIRFGEDTSSSEAGKSRSRKGIGADSQFVKSEPKRSITVRTLESTPPVPEDSSGLGEMITRFESRGTRRSIASSTQPVVDTIRIHTVVQNVIRDDLREKPLIGEHDYWWWLAAAVKLLTSSWNVAADRLRHSSGPSLVRDYREYEAQAARLLQHFPRSSLNATAELRKARHEVRQILKTVKREIHAESPSSSSEMGSSGEKLYQGSVFEGASSTSEETQSFSTLSPTSTWSIDERPPSESPTQMHGSQLEYHEFAVPPRPAATEMGEDAIHSDSDTWPVSDTTEIPRSRRSSVLSSALLAVMEGKPRLKQTKDLGDFHQLKASPTTMISQPDVAFEQSSRSTSENRSRPSSSSEAELALALMHRASPPASRGSGRLRSTSRGSGERPPLAIRSPNTPLSPLAATFQPGDGFIRPAKAQPRNPSSSPRLVQALLNSQVGMRSRAEQNHPPVEQIDVLYPAAQFQRPPLATQQPPRIVTNQNYLPSGYQSLPMSRNTSRESDTTRTESSSNSDLNIVSASQRALSDPHILGFDAPTHYRFNTQQNYRPLQNLTFGRVDEWANIAPSRPTYPQALQFGAMDPVSIDEARARAGAAREASNERGRGRRRGSVASSSHQSQGLNENHKGL